MSKNFFCLIAVLSILCLGCSGPSRILPPKINASDAGKAALKQYDTNEDGEIAGEELAACPAFLASMVRLDTDGNGAITGEEITARIEKWQESNTGLMQTRCVVKYRKKPLVNAKMVWEPEAFLGENIKAGEGTTNANGVVSLKQAGNKQYGMPLGFYRIKITSDSTQLSPKYNDGSALGIEFAQDNDAIGEGDIRINLN